MCEPLALGAEPALLLALRGAVGEPVVAHDVVLGQITGPLLPRDCGGILFHHGNTDHTTKSEQVKQYALVRNKPKHKENVSNLILSQLSNVTVL